MPVAITAPMAEVACSVVRDRIREEKVDMDPVAAFDVALTDGNVDATVELLNGAWFGVPESTSCWRLTGFKEAVGLLDDPPDDLEGAE